MKTVFGTEILLSVVLAALFVSLMPVSAGNGVVGVKPGDWVKYGEISVKYQSDPLEPAPQELVDWNNTEWAKIEVQSVSGTNVTAMEIRQFKNGTENTETHTWNITDQTRFWWPLWYRPDLFVIEANLSKGDLINIHSLRLTETISRKYAGRTREVNQMNKTFLQGHAVLSTVDTYWDKTTGILCELNEVRRVERPTSDRLLTTTTKMIETNLWKPSSIWTESLLWLITGVVVAAIAVSAIWGWRRRKMSHPEREVLIAPT